MFSLRILAGPYNLVILITYEDLFGGLLFNEETARPMKKCFKCNINKPLNEFCSDKRRPDGKGSECLACKRLRSKKYRKQGKDKEYWQKEEVKQRKREWNKKDYKLNKEKYRSNNKKWIKENYKRHRRNQTASCAKYRALKKKATPPWANLEAIRQFYLNCPEGMEVDHIIPLQNDKVCGLHVLENLQYLSRSDNAKKSNKLMI